jgi:hypothetical protein
VTVDGQLRAVLGRRLNSPCGRTEKSDMARILLGIGVLALGTVAAAQVNQQPSLGAVARAAQAEKAKTAAAPDPESKPPTKPDGAATPPANAKTEKTEKTEKPAAKKYTNEDIGERPRPVPVPGLPGRTVFPIPPKPAPVPTSTTLDRSKDEAYWRTRSEPVRRMLQDATDRLNAVKARLESISGGLDVAAANGQQSPVQMERQRLNYQLQDLDAQARQAQAAMNALEDEARKAGALPGWLR